MPAVLALGQTEPEHSKGGRAKIFLRRATPKRPGGTPVSGMTCWVSLSGVRLLPGQSPNDGVFLTTLAPRFLLPCGR